MMIGNTLQLTISPLGDVLCASWKHVLLVDREPWAVFVPLGQPLTFLDAVWGICSQ